MADQALIFTRRGQQIAELPSSITRAWQMSRTINAARGQFTIPANSPTATQANLNYGNIVYVQSSSGVQPWAGIIAPPMKIKDGIITVNLKSIEYVLSFRITPRSVKPSGSPAALFKKLLGYWAFDGAIEYPIDIASTVTVDNGVAQKIDLNCNYSNIYEECNNLANNSYNYWWLEPVYEAGRLTLIPHIESKIGRNFRTRLVENLNFNDVEINEIADDFANSITGWSDVEMQDKEDDFYEANDGLSQAKYGRIEGTLATNYDNNEGIRLATEASLLERAYPLIQLTGAVTVRPFPLAGDNVEIELSSAGAFLVRNRGQLLSAIITAASYSPDTDEMFVTAKEMTPGVEQ